MKGEGHPTRLLVTAPLVLSYLILDVTYVQLVSFEELSIDDDPVLQL